MKEKRKGPGAGSPEGYIIRALRCSSTPGSECMGTACPFCVEEQIPEELRETLRRDVVEICDTDRIARLAADWLEELTAKEEKDQCIS